MNKKQILFLSPLPPPYYGSALSSQTCLNVLIDGNKYDVVNIQLNYSRTYSDVEKLSIRKIAGYFYTLFKAILISRKKPDLVYLMPSTTGFAFIRDFSLALVLKALNKNMVYHLRTQVLESQKKHFIKGYIFRKAFKNSKVIVLGKELKKDIEEYFTPENTYILPNAIEGKVDDMVFSNIQEIRKSSAALRLIFISNMSVLKGWKKALEAAYILHQNNYDFTFHFAGSWPSGKEEKEFYSLVEKYGINDKVVFLGYIDDKQKEKVLSDSDVMVFPTEYEALPRVIIEAYKFGIPVISTKTGSIPSMIVHGKTGYLLEEITASEIASLLMGLYDKEKLLAMGRNARDRYNSTYELSVFSKNFHAIVEKCM